MSKTVTISSRQFTVPTPFEDGHVITANQAAALNQVFAENLRNNFAGKVKAALEAGAFDQDAMQSELDAYAESYEFGRSISGGGGSAVRGDPVMSEARAIARAALSAKLRASGRKVSDVSKDKMDAAIAMLLERDPNIRAEAERRVAEKKALLESATSSVGDDPFAGIDFGDGQTETPVATPEAATSRRRRGSTVEAAAE